MSGVLREGCLLVASPALLDPDFRRGVVLVISHAAEGSFGLLLNRPTGQRLDTVLPEVAPGIAAVPVLQGGPVQTNLLQFACRDEAGGQQVLAGVGIGADLEDLLARHPEGEGVHAYLGYSGWSAGQLEHETAEGSWIVAPGRAEHVFGIPSETLWSSVLRELGGRYAWMAIEAGEPGDN